MTNERLNKVYDLLVKDGGAGEHMRGRFIHDYQLEYALEALRYELITHDENNFSLRNNKAGSQTRLKAGDLSSALSEAWNLVSHEKPNP